MLVEDYYKELYHHGIKGQKWGVKNGPPYPLGTSDHSSSEKKAGWRKSLDKSSAEKHTKNIPDKSEEIIFIEKGKQFVERIKSQKIPTDAVGSGEEYIIPVLATTVSVLANVGISKLRKNFSRRRDAETIHRLNETKEIKSFADAPRLSQKMGAKDSMKLTNPDYPSEGTTMNCTFCTTAMVLREKGYDVSARKAPKNDGFYSDTLFGMAFNAPEFKMSKARSGQDILNTLILNGDGSYGNLSVYWKYGGGHSIFWKNENGQIHIYDGQNGTEITKSGQSTADFMNQIVTNKTLYSRLDNCEPTEYALALVESNKKRR